MEDPNEEFQLLRDINDYVFLTNQNAFSNLPSLPIQKISLWKENVDSLRRKWKLSKRQMERIIEIWLLNESEQKKLNTTISVVKVPIQKNGFNMNESREKDKNKDKDNNEFKDENDTFETLDERYYRLHVKKRIWRQNEEVLQSIKEDDERRDKVHSSFMNVMEEYQQVLDAVKRYKSE